MPKIEAKLKINTTEAQEKMKNVIKTAGATKEAMNQVALAAARMNEALLQMYTTMENIEDWAQTDIKSNDETTVISENIGMAGTTECHVQQQADGTFEARIGIALMGATNMDEVGFEQCNHNPFHEKFYDNYASGTGNTQEEAIAAMKVDMSKMADSLWAE